jgi:rubrerythrin
MLATKGFREVSSMEGGIRAWEGLLAEGVPESGMAFFTVASRPEELIGLAWTLEEGSRKFYSEISSLLDDREAITLFQTLSAAEEHHKLSLMNLYKVLSGAEPDPGFPGSLIPAETSGDLMEGGVRVSEALTWAKGKVLVEVLELAISLETNSYDLYIKMERQMGDENSRRVFIHLSREEKEHLAWLAALLDKKL